MYEALKALSESPVGLSEDERSYELDGENYTRVTDIIKKALPPYLVPWAENTGIQATHSVYETMGGSLPPDWTTTRDMARQMGKDTESQKKAGANRGANIHFANDAWIEQGIPPSLEDFEPEHRPYAQAYCQFLVDYEPEFECSEVTVWHPDLKYAGTFDAIATLTKRPPRVRHPDVRGKRLILDYKTNKDKRIYFPQHHFQLAAYRHGLDFHGVPVDGEAVVAIGPKKEGGGLPYCVGVNYVPARLWPPVVAMWRAIEEAQALNPSARKK